MACFAHERHKAVPGGADAIPRAYDGFDLHVIEFDDEGRPWNAERIDLTLERLKSDLVEPAVVVLFVHGWKNDANVCNGNLSCFREVLEVLAKVEKAFEHLTGHKARQVIGVYVGWRGGSISAPAVKQLTFWGRKHTAHTIGDNGAVTQFIGRLRQIVDNSPPRIQAAARKDRRSTTVVFVGHSFGAALLFSALATSINRQVGEALQTSVKNGAPARSATQTPATQTREPSLAQAFVAPDKCVSIPNTGDLVVLVNPAMEASRFANLNQASQLCYEESQIPILMTLGSEADSAVGFFFPIGQSFATLFRAARSRDAWLSMAEGFGMYKPFLTHRLALKQEVQSPSSERVGGHCRCPGNLAAFGDALVMNLREFHESLARSAPGRQLLLAEYREFMYSRLEPARDVDPNNPFLMVEVDRAIVGGHSDIFNARFMNFIVEFVALTELKRGLKEDYDTVKRSR